MTLKLSLCLLVVTRTLSMTAVTRQGHPITNGRVLAQLLCSCSSCVSAVLIVTVVVVVVVAGLVGILVVKTR